MHELLKRQMKRFFQDPKSLPEECRQFIKAVDKAYETSDADHKMVERSLELTSEEFVGVNRKLEKEIDQHKRTAEELKKRNTELERFNKFAIDRELKMVSLKEKIRYLEQRLKKLKG